jgi:hypothetical protein
MEHRLREEGYIDLTRASIHIVRSTDDYRSDTLASVRLVELAMSPGLPLTGGLGGDALGRAVTIGGAVDGCIVNGGVVGSVCIVGRSAVVVIRTMVILLRISGSGNDRGVLGVGAGRRDHGALWTDWVGMAEFLAERALLLRAVLLSMAELSTQLALPQNRAAQQC